MASRSYGLYSYGLHIETLFFYKVVAVDRSLAPVRLWPHVVTAYEFMAYKVMACKAMAYIVMAYTFMAYTSVAIDRTLHPAATGNNTGDT